MVIFPGGVLLLTQTSIANWISNLDSSRFKNASLDKREAGWTETWGGVDTSNTSDETTASSEDWKVDDETISNMLATNHPQLPITLVQYRPAWLEQLVLHIAGIPHIVVNSHFASHEATGPLPYLRDIRHPLPPMLVGRQNPSSKFREGRRFQNCILDHIISSHGIDLDSHVAEDKKIMALSKCFTTLVTVELRNILLYLRYEDLDAWQQVHRKQCIGGKSKSWFTSFYGPFQAWSERAMARKELGDNRHIQTIEQVIARAKECYEAIEVQLSQQHDGRYLLGTLKPMFVDALLWDHLAEALCDVHLVVALSAYPRVIKYFQKMYDTYFDNGNTDVWYKWNQQQNSINQFQSLPILSDSSKSNSEIAKFKDAFELMQRLSAREHDLQEVLTVAAQKRQNEPRVTSANNNSGNNFYRWRMGDDFKTKENKDEAQHDHPLRKKLQREQKHNDQVWISGVLGVSVLAALLLRGNQKKK